MVKIRDMGVPAQPLNTFCSYCGNKFSKMVYPRVCGYCGKETYLNAPAVGIGLVPINNGLLLVRRNIEPMRGHLALPGGYKNVDETWEQGIAREVFEETGVKIDATTIDLIGVKTANNGAVLVFGQSRWMHLPEPIPFNIDPVETQEAIITTEPVTLAFPHHQAVMDAYFDSLHS